MGTVHQLPNAAETQIRLLENLVRNLIAEHPDPDVAARWIAMAEKTIARYPGPPSPSQPVLDLSSVSGLNGQQVVAIQALTDQWLCSYFADVRKQLMSVHHDLLTLQKKLAELQASNS
jgi:hypothetical protein